jgi:hypothetical protein
MAHPCAKDHQRPARMRDKHKDRKKKLHQFGGLNAQWNKALAPAGNRG